MYIPGLTSPYLMRECDGVGGWMRAKIRAVQVQVQVQVVIVHTYRCKINDLMKEETGTLRSLDPLFLLLP